MTAPPAGALEACLALLEKATLGPWVRATSFRGVYSQHPAPGPVQVCRVPENYDWPKQWEANADAMVAAVNTLRAHGPALLAALRLREGCEARIRAWRAGGPCLIEQQHVIYDACADDLARVLEEGE